MGVHGHGHQLEGHGRDTLHPEGKVGHPHQPQNITMFRLELEYIIPKISHKNLQIWTPRDILCNHAEPQDLLYFIREGWNLAFIFNASLSQDTVVCRSGLTCVVQEVVQVEFECFYFWTFGLIAVVQEVIQVESLL